MFGSSNQLVAHKHVPGDRLRINITFDKGLSRAAYKAA